MDFDIIDKITDFFGHIALGKLMGSASILKILLALSVLFLALTEVAKVIVRKNIGLKALNIYGILVGCTLLFFWTVIVAIISIIGILLPISFYLQNFDFSNPFQSSNYSNPWILLFCLAGIYIGWAARYWFRFSKKVLFLGMNEHYKAKALDSQDWRVREYRGDSVDAENLLNQGWTREKIWTDSDPKQFILISMESIRIHPFIIVPLLVIT